MSRHDPVQIQPHLYRCFQLNLSLLVRSFSRLPLNSMVHVRVDSSLDLSLSTFLAISGNSIEAATPFDNRYLMASLFVLKSPVRSISSTNLDVFSSILICTVSFAITITQQQLEVLSFVQSPELSGVHNPRYHHFLQWRFN